MTQQGARREGVPGRRDGANFAWLLISGISIGWLAGLSVSPVLATVLSSLLAAVGGAVAGLQSFRKTENPAPIRPRGAPVGLLLLGVAAAAPVGVMVRTHCWLEKGGICPPQRADSSVTGFRAAAGVGGLFNSLQQRADWCQATLQASDRTLANTMKVASDQKKWIVEIADSVNSPQALRRIVEALCEGS